MNADEFCRCAVRSALVRLNISFGISIGGKLVYTFRDNTSPMPRQMSVRSVVKLICSTVALWCYHAAGKMEATCYSQPYALDPFQGSLFCVSILLAKEVRRMLDTRLQCPLRIIQLRLACQRFYAGGVGTKCLLYKQKLFTSPLNNHSPLPEGRGE